MVAEHVNERSLRKVLQGLLQAVAAGADVAGQDYSISLHRRRSEGLKFQVQVAENVKAHCFGGQAPPTVTRQARSDSCSVRIGIVTKR